MRNLFIGPILVSILGLALAYWWGGLTALFLTAALAALEITLSFDNAVVNAGVLKQMTPHWQQRFLTWGMAISVLGARLLFPILIVSVVVVASPLLIAKYAFFEPAHYAALIGSSGAVIEAFGGSFLILVALDYFLDGGKTVHWLRVIERRLARWGQVEAIEIAIALAVLFLLSFIAHAPQFLVLKAGVAGVILYIFSKGIMDALGAETHGDGATRAGFALFAYVSILDTAFSLDGVVGAFALTTALPIIVIGLGIGAYFVRTLTLVLVRGGTLEKLMYLEHGAHWAIFALALSMFTGLVVEVPEWFIATVGLALIFLAYLSSRRALNGR